MTNSFEDLFFKDIFTKNKLITGNLVKSSEFEINGTLKVSCEDDDLDGIRILLKKDANDSIKEIKFICACGQSKTLILDYSE